MKPRIRVLHRTGEAEYTVQGDVLTGPGKVKEVIRVEFYRSDAALPYCALDAVGPFSTVELEATSIEIEAHLACPPLQNDWLQIEKTKISVSRRTTDELLFKSIGSVDKPGLALSAFISDPNPLERLERPFQSSEKPILWLPAPAQAGYNLNAELRLGLVASWIGPWSKEALATYSWIWSSEPRSIELPTSVFDPDFADVKKRLDWIQPVEAVAMRAPAVGYSPTSQKWLVRAAPLTPRSFAELWNRTIASPYLTALETVSGVSDLSFAPSVIADASAKAFASLSFVLDPTPAAPHSIQQLDVWKPPTGAATFVGRLPGAHDRDEASRRLELALELRAPTLEDKIDTYSRESLAAPYLSVPLDVKKVSSFPLAGPDRYWLRVGALDLAFRFGVPSGAWMTLEAELADVVLEEPRPPRTGRLTRLLVSSDRLPIADAVGGSEDPPPDALRSSGTLEDRVALAPTSVVFEIDDAPAFAAPLLLEIEESVATNRARALTLRLRKEASPEAVPATRRLVYVGREPFLIAEVEVPPLDQIGRDYDEIGNWSLSEREGNRWELASVGDGFTLVLPPQAVGEAMEKNLKQSRIEKGKPVDYRFGSTARGRLRSSYFRQRSAEAPWNLRRVLGYPGQRAPGAPLDALRFELVYGMTGRIDAAGAGLPLHLAELGSRVGALSDPIDRVFARSRGYGENDPRRDIFERYRARWTQLLTGYRSRLAALELYSPGEFVARPQGEVAIATGDLTLDRGVSFELRKKATLKYPIAEQRILPGPDPRNEPPHDEKSGLEGGVTWAFESDAIYRALWRDPKSTSGRVSRLFLTGLGGYGEQRAGFDKNRTFLTSTTQLGRLHRLTVERVGRIAVLWHRAKHVIVYERTTLASDQFASTQHELIGRPILRKTEEYVELLQPMREYPDLAGTKLGRGCVERVQFRTIRIPVDGAWGRDVPSGFEIPLWKPLVDPFLYPKPQIQVVTAGDREGRVEQVGADQAEPDRLYFYSSTDPALDDRTDLWPAVAGVDFTNEPTPEPELDDPVDPDDPDAPLPDALVDVPGFERFTWPLSDPPQPSNLVVERSPSALGAKLFSVSMMRGEPARERGAYGAGYGALATVRRELEQARMRMVAELGKSAEFDDRAREGLRREITRAKRLREKLRERVADADGFVKRIHGEASQWNPCNAIRSEVGARLTAEVADKRRVLKEWRAKVDKELEYRPEQMLSSTLVRDLVGSWVAQLDTLLRPLRCGLEGVRSRIAEARAELLAVRAKLLAVFDEVMDVVASGELGRSDARAVVEEWLATTAEELARQLGLLAREDPVRVQPLFDRLATRLKAEVPKAVREGAGKILSALDAMGDNWLAALDEVIAEARLLVFGDLDDSTDEYKDLAGLVRLLGGAEQKVGKAVDAIVPATATSETLKKTILDDIGENLPVAELRGRVQKAADEADKIFTAFAAEVENKAKAAEKLFCNGGPLEWIDKVLDPEAFTKALDKLSDHLDKELEALLAGGSASLTQALEDVEKAWAPLAESAGRLEARARTMLGDLGRSPTFRDPSSTLRLIRAVGEGPLLPEMKFNRDRIAYFFDDYAAAVRTSPVAALVNRVGDDLKAFGLRVPTRSLLDRVVPDSLQNFDLSTILPDFAALRNSAFFKKLRLPSVANDGVRLRHGIDKANQTAWLRADVAFPLGRDAQVFSAGPLALELRKADFTAKSELTAALGGGLRKRAEGAIVGDWQLKVGGASIVTFAKTELRFNDAGRIDFQIRPERIQLDRALKWLADLVQSFSDPDKGFTIELVEADGKPVGVRCCLDLPLPPISSGAFAIAGLALGASLALGVDPVTRAFGITLGFNLGRKVEPFTLTIAFLGGGGWLESSALYVPARGTLDTQLTIGIVAGAGCDINLGPIRGSVYLQFGIFAEVHKSGTGSARASIGIMLLLRGQVVVLSIVTVTLCLLLQAVYSSGVLIGSGTLSITIRISRFFKVTVRKQVRYKLAGKGGGAEQFGAAAAMTEDDISRALKVAKRRAALLE